MEILKKFASHNKVWDFIPMRFLSVYIAAIAFLSWPCGSAKAQEFTKGSEIRGLFKVVDSDTLKKGGIKFRIVGIDGPDKGKDKPMSHFFDRSNEHMEAIAKRPLQCVTTGAKSYDRFVARCFVIATQNDVGALMVMSGYAVEWKKFSKGIYTKLEQSAKRAERGMWAEMNESWR